MIATHPIQVLANFGFLVALSIAQLVQYIFFGSLLTIEVEVRLSYRHLLPLINIPAAIIRSHVVLCHGVPPGLHHLPGRVRYTIWNHVWLSLVRQIVPLAYGRSC